jgi:hypothetical protein
MTRAKEREVIKAEKAYVHEIRTARLAAGAAAAARARATAEVKAAHDRRMAAAEAKARGDVEAADRFHDADHDWHEAQARLELAQVDDEAAGRVRRSAEARLAQLRETQWAEFAAAAEDVVAKCAEAAEALAEPLKRYLDSYFEAVATWRRLSPASQAQVVAADRAVGRYRDLSAVMEDAALPDCPVPLNAAELTRSVMPRPKFLNGDHAPADGDGVVITDVLTSTS